MRLNKVLLTMMLLSTMLGASATAPGTLQDRLTTDFQVAARLTPRIYRHSPNLGFELAQKISFSTARWSRNAVLIYGLDIEPERLAEIMVELIWKESNYNPRCHSATNDSGLTQLHNRAIYDVDINIREGIYHLCGNLKASGGDLASAFYHYNGSWRYSRALIAQIAEADKAMGK